MAVGAAVRARSSTLAVGFALFTTLLTSNGPSPLYVIFQKRFGFAASSLTAVFAIYAVAVLITLVVVGRLSDVIGRRRVMFAAVLCLITSAALFAGARDLAWLFVARAVQGVGTGAMTAAATAALVELDPERDRQRASLVNTSAFLGGAALGPLLFGSLAEYLPWPTVLPFVADILLLSIGLLGLRTVPETVDRHADVARWQLQRPRVPPPVLAPFALAGVVVALSWSVGALFASLGPSINRQLLHVKSHAAAGLVLFMFFALGGVGQLALRRWTSRRAMGSGAVCVGTGMILVYVSFVSRSIPLFLLGTVLAGVGSGLGFMGSLTLINEIAPPLRRAELVSAFNVVGYVALSMPVVGVGYLAAPLGLEGATGVFTAGVVILAISALIAVLRAPAHPLEQLTPAELAELGLTKTGYVAR
ncbi:MAG: MFS transporter [Acidimicrobiales bacterium]